MKNSWRIILLSIILSGCDPWQGIQITPGKTINASVVLYFNSNPFKYTQMPKVIRVSNTDTCCNKEFTIGFGIGVWDKASLNIFTQTVDSIVITHEGKETRLKQKDEVQTYFTKHLSVFAKSFIHIDVE